MANTTRGPDDEVKATLDHWKKRRNSDANNAFDEPPTRDEMPKNVEQPELRVRRRKDDEEVQYNVRVPRWLKSKLQDLVRDERLPLADILPKMLDLYVQHRKRRKEHAGVDDEAAPE